ncbi:hypothetical protein [Paenibacillus hexagrammi]|uniref:Uncharacterized protein n=1 Tax=Paenibacillus hexagrammi TaxID=2908839 RepID=A0ABY3SNF1_9BACL|nr:hypothetical protein [Paenibacillus sp. YPD9-1]UJF34965.1 hypothetical protein L0M14_07420 [Paenibacillus sp. YPD9-1]
MPKQILASITMSACMLLSTASAVYATPASQGEAALSIQAPGSVTKGSAFQISGTSSLTEVTIKIVGPNQIDLFFDVQKVVNGTFQDTFTVPADDLKWPTGMYTIAVGQGTQVKTATFEVKKSGSQHTGSGGGGGHLKNRQHPPNHASFRLLIQIR